MQDITWLADKEVGAKLKSVIMVQAVRAVIGQEKTTERRYFISSLGANAQPSLRARPLGGGKGTAMVLGYWLPRRCVSDQEARAAENLATIRHIRLNLLKQEKSCRLRIKSNRKKAGWDQSCLLKVLKM